MIFIMLTRLTGQEVHPGQYSLEELQKRVEEKINSNCPDVEWISNYAICGPYDYLDVFTAPDLDTAIKVATLVRSFGHAKTEIWPAIEWKQFKELVHSLPRETK